MLQSKQVLVIAPHPDDETFGCGGTLAILAEAGVLIDVVYLTSGELGYDFDRVASQCDQQRLAGLRQQEARAACDVLGVRSVEFLAGLDGRVRQCPWLVEALTAKLRAQPYERVFCPWQNDAHGDHRAAYEFMRQAVLICPTLPSLWLYEVWTPLPATRFVPIDIAIDRKRAAMREHRSQLACLNYLGAFEGLARYRALFAPPSEYVEAFLVVPAERLATSGDAFAGINLDLRVPVHNLGEADVCTTNRLTL